MSHILEEGDLINVIKSIYKKEKIDLYDFCRDIVDAYQLKYPEFVCLLRLV